MQELGSPKVETSHGEHCRLNVRHGYGWLAVTTEIYYGRMLWLNTFNGVTIDN